MVCGNFEPVYDDSALYLDKHQRARLDFRCWDRGIPYQKFLELFSQRFHRRITDVSQIRQAEFYPALRLIDELTKRLGRGTIFMSGLLNQAEDNQWR